VRTIRSLRSSFFAALTAWGLLNHTAHGQTIYDGALGTLPEAQGWSYVAVNFGTVIATMSNNSVLLDTTSTTLNSDGWSEIAAPDLIRAASFTLLFTLKMNAEAHNNANRAGFSCIALGSDTNGIELGFWTTTIFAQSDNPLFTHAEDVAFVTTNGFVNYALTVAGTNYTLRANGTTILSGPTRNYTAFSGPINPYRTPNFLFFGDDTTSAAGSANWQSAELVRSPALAIARNGILSWTGVSNLNYTVLASTNLTTWTSNATVSSASGNCFYTNGLTPARRFYRVSFP